MNNNAQFNIDSAASGYTETTTVSKEHLTLEDGGTTKTTKTTQQNIKTLQFTTDAQFQASLSIF